MTHFFARALRFARPLLLSSMIGAAFVPAVSSAQTFQSSQSSTSFSFPSPQTPSQQFQCLSTPLTPFAGNIVDAAVATPELSTLVQLLVAANLTGALSGPGPLTVYAPTNAAFGKIPAAVLGAIGSNIPVLTSVLTYHVSPGLIDPRFNFQPREVPTLQGQTLFQQFKSNEGPRINQSVANCRGVRTSNGVVWIIDSVLQPQYR